MIQSMSEANNDVLLQSLRSRKIGGTRVLDFTKARNLPVKKIQKLGNGKTLKFKYHRMIANGSGNMAPAPARGNAQATY